MNAAAVAETAREFTENDISAGLTAQVASVVRLAGIAEVELLAETIFTNPAAGAVMHSYLSQSVAAGRDSEAIAGELGLVSDLQRLAAVSDPKRRTA